tara:strand:- start:3007 stop:3477 length:471 start_codon:yes stop_codon:yes gene_type:complete
MSIYDEDDGQQVEESGSSLRQKLEDTLKEKNELARELSGLKADAIIKELGLSLVKPEDLKGVKLSEMTETAQTLHSERQAQQVELAREMLSRKGFEGEELDREVEAFLDVPAGPDVAAHARVKEASQVGGTTAPVKDPRSLFGLDSIEAALAKKTK